MMNSNEWIDAWMHDELGPEQRKAFEAARSADKEFALQVDMAQRLGDSLKRSFDPGTETSRGVSAVLEAIRKTPERNAEVASYGMVGACLAAAAGLLLMLAKFDQGPAVEREEVLLGELSPLPMERHMPRFEGAEHLDSGRVVPNLEGLLCAASEFAERRATEQCSDAELAVGRALVGQAVGLTQDALGILEGPILAPEWPGSTVFAHRDQAGLSLLIASPNELNTCCLEVKAPSGTDLQVRTWLVGETLWYEISPYSEPRLLAYVEARP